MDLIQFMAAGCVAVIVYAVSAEIYCSYSFFSKTTSHVIAGAIALLVLFGWLDLERSVQAVLLLLFAALGMLCLCFVFVHFLFRNRDQAP